MCVLWGLNQPLIEFKPQLPILYSNAKGCTTVGSSGSFKHWQIDNRVYMYLSCYN